MIVLQWVRFVLAALLMSGGLAVLSAAAAGMFRFRCVLNRVHVAAKCDTFGVLLTFSSLMLSFGWSAASLKLLLIIIFIWIANPVSGHLIAHLEVATNPGFEDECEVLRHVAG
jgi:multicomponent Na+:H+ antiporter subunit G